MEKQERIVRLMQLRRDLRCAASQMVELLYDQADQKLDTHLPSQAAAQEFLARFRKQNLT